MNPLGQAEQHSLPGTRSDTQAWREKWLLLLLLVLLVVMVVAVVLQLLFQIVWNSTRATIDWEWCIASIEITCCTPLVVRTSPKQSAKPNVILIKHPFFIHVHMHLENLKAAYLLNAYQIYYSAELSTAPTSLTVAVEDLSLGVDLGEKTTGDTYVCRPRGRHKQL